MQILVSETAHALVAGRLAAMGPDLDVVTMGAEGVFKRGGEVVDGAEVDPEVYWVSIDMVRSGLLPKVFDRAEAGTGGRMAQLFAAGLDAFGFKRLMQKGLRLAKSTAQAPPIAEYVMSHALSLLHPIAEQARAQEAHKWRRVGFREIASTRWVLVGFGAIGRNIAARLQPFGAHLTVVRNHPAPDPLAAEVRSSADLISLLPDADVVVLALPATDATRGMADEAFFQAMKPGAIFINIARGSLVDEAALKAGLDRDQPGQAVLDVFETEPLPEDAWFWDHPKVRVTAHCCNAGDGVEERGATLFLENLRRYRAGEPLLNEARREEAGL